MSGCVYYLAQGGAADVAGFVLVGAAVAVPNDGMADGRVAPAMAL